MASTAGSTLQLSAFQASIASATEVATLRGWLEQRTLPPGIELDLELRWRMLFQLAAMGESDRAELDVALQSEPTARSRVEHARSTAALPDVEAKAWAWARFVGEVDAPNYELDAIGAGMWRPGQEHLTEPYVERYFVDVPGTVDVRSGWSLADVAAAFYPSTALSEETVAHSHALMALADLDPSIRRRVVDLTDDLERRLAVRRAYPA